MRKKFSRKSTNQFPVYGIITGRDSLRGNKISNEYGIRVIDIKANDPKVEYAEIYIVIYERRNVKKHKQNTSIICQISPKHIKQYCLAVLAYDAIISYSLAVFNSFQSSNR